MKIMIPRKLKPHWLLAIMGLWLAGSLAVQAQQRTGGGGGGGGGFGGGGFGGGGNGGGNRTSSSSSSSTGSSSVDYPNATQPGNATFGIDPDTHSLLIMTDPATYAQISTVVSNLDRPKPQVLIKVVFLEVQYDDALDFGVEGTYNHNPSPSSINAQSISDNFGLASLGNVGQQIGQTTMPTGEGLYSIMASDYQATVRAIASAQKVEVISRPSIMVRNNQPATITVGQSVPLVTSSTVNSLTGSPTSTIAYQNVGIILQVTPFISSDGLVEMIVAPQISDLSSQTVAVSSNTAAPVIDLRSASTVVVTPDGQTVIIGGLMENDKTVIDSKVPLLGDIPLLGALFTHHQKAVTKKELMIFLTPHVVTMPGQIASLSDSEARHADLSRKAFGEQELDKFFDRLPSKPHSVWEKPASSGN
jgi:general secretion pathway protein D